MKDLVKNPIGIIALFISLIYGFANLLLGVTASSLTPDERYPLIIFIVLFPVVVLGVYYMLVSRHHGKLYAPGDYKDDKSFLRTLSQEEREQKLEKEAQEALPASVGTNDTKAGSPTARAEPTPSVEEIRRDLRLVEALVVSKLEAEFSQRAERDVGVADTEVSFDAFLGKTGDKLTFLEIKNMRYPSSASMLLDRVLYSAMVADRALSSNFKLVLAVVYHFDKEELARVESHWRRRIEACPASIDLRFIQRSELGA